MRGWYTDLFASFRPSTEVPQALLARLRAAIGTAAVLLAVGAFGGCHYKQSQWDASTAKQQEHAQQQTAQQSADSPKVEIRYVDRIKEIKVPVVQIRDRLVSACPGGVHHTGRAEDRKSTRLNSSH